MSEQKEVVAQLLLNYIGTLDTMILLATEIKEPDKVRYANEQIKACNKVLTGLAEQQEAGKFVKVGAKEKREILGMMVRVAWVNWAKEQPNPKPSWLVPWAELSEDMKEADRRIGDNFAGYFGDIIDRLRALKCPPISDGDTCICPIEELEAQLTAKDEEIKRLTELLKSFRQCELCMHFSTEFKSDDWWKYCNPCGKGKNNWELM